MTLAPALAPAKINLTLDVLGRRPDGYHELETLFLALPWGDGVGVTLEDEPGIRLELECADPNVPADERNLAARAARAWMEAAARVGRPHEGGVRVRLKKAIPSGAGLGGGSSDAATVLRLLAEAHPVLDPETLRGLALGLGADVPFLLEGGRAAIGRGRGDVLERLPDPPPFDVVLILLGASFETARVFAHVEAGTQGPTDRLERAVEALASGDVERLRHAHHNALLRPAGLAYPSFPLVHAEIGRRLGRSACMTGSGSTLYDLAASGMGTKSMDRLRDAPQSTVLVRGEG